MAVLSEIDRKQTWAHLMRQEGGFPGNVAKAQLRAALDTLFRHYSSKIQRKEPPKKKEQEPPKKKPTRKPFLDGLSEEDFLTDSPPKREFVRLGKRKNGVANANAR